VASITTGVVLEKIWYVENLLWGCDIFHHMSCSGTFYPRLPPLAEHLIYDSW